MPMREKVKQLKVQGGLAVGGATGLSGALTLGAAGTDLTQIRVYTPLLTPAIVAAITVAEQTFTVTGLTTADKVCVNPPSHVAGVGITHARVSAANTLAIGWVNPTAAGVTPPAGVYTVVAIRS